MHRTNHFLLKLTISALVHFGIVIRILVINRITRNSLCEFEDCTLNVIVFYLLLLLMDNYLSTG